MEPFKLSKNFMLGTASSATQIEGGDANNTWYRWCGKGHISDGSSCYTACDHWNRLSQDTGILKDLRIQTHRLSLEWSRIEPAPGRFSRKAIEHYREELKLLLDAGIRPLVTLHHFSDPLWFADSGGWNHPGNTGHFLSYVRFAVENLGDLCSDWVTFNEPNVYSIFGYLLGIFPPGIRKGAEAFGVMSALIETHCEAYRLIHEIRTEQKFPQKTMVGAAMHIRVFDGITAVGRRTAAFVDYFFHKLFMEGMTKGRLLYPLSKQEHKPKKGGYADFLGINYYTRNIVEFVFDPRNYFYRLIGDNDLSKSDIGWDIYPEGIYRVCQRYYGKYKLPIYITENGISDGADSRRPDYIADHLAFVARAAREGIAVERYYHWSFLDNFEWLEGERGNFGLYRCDFRTQKRTPRKSAGIYAAICEKKELTRQMIEEFKQAREKLPET